MWPSTSRTAQPSQALGAFQSSAVNVSARPEKAVWSARRASMAAVVMT